MVMVTLNTSPCMNGSNNACNVKEFFWTDNNICMSTQPPCSAEAWDWSVFSPTGLHNETSIPGKNGGADGKYKYECMKA